MPGQAAMTERKSKSGFLKKNTSLNKATEQPGANLNGNGKNHVHVPLIAKEPTPKKSVQSFSEEVDKRIKIPLIETEKEILKRLKLNKKDIEKVVETVFAEKTIPINKNCSLSPLALNMLCYKIIEVKEECRDNLAIVKDQLAFSDDQSNGTEEIFSNARQSSHKERYYKEINDNTKKCLELDAVLNEIKRGTYSNKCKACQEPIEFARLWEIPQAKHCMTHKDRENFF